MASLTLDHASVDIPVYDYSARKLVKSVKRFASSSEHLGGRTVVKALHDISLTLEDGDRLGIIGPNGSGKTTLLRLLSGVYFPTSGSISTSGKIGSLLDISFGIEPDLTGRESIALRARILGMPISEVNRKKDEIIEFSGLGSFIDMPTRTYSSGMFVRLAFSIATVLAPDILIMDEWLSVGDQDFKDKAEKRLEHLVSQTKILVLASHSRELISRTCNKAIWLEGGQIVANGDPETVCQQYFDQGAP